MKPDINVQLRLHTLMLRASEGSLSESEQRELDSLLQDEANRQTYLEFTAMSTYLGSSTSDDGVTQIRRPVSLRRWLLGTVAVAAALLLVVVLYLGRSPALPPERPAQSEKDINMVFIDDQYNSRIYYIQRRLRGVDTSQLYMKKRSTSEAIRGKIQQLKQEPIFTKENKDVQQSAIRIGSRRIIAGDHAAGLGLVTG